MEWCLYYLKQQCNGVMNCRMFGMVTGLVKVKRVVFPAGQSLYGATGKALTY